MSVEKIAKTIEKINVKKCIVFLIALSIVPVLYLSFFSSPSVDDYDFGSRTKAVVETGSFNPIDYIKAASDTVVHYYNSWQGMYSATFVSALQPGVFGEHLYFLTPVIMIALCLIGFLFTGKRLFWLINVDKKTAIFLSLVIWFYFFQTMPSPREGMFWFNGAFTYIGFLAITMMNLTVLLEQHKNGSRVSTIVLTSIIAIFISGGSVPVAFFNILFMILMIGYVLAFDKAKVKCIPYIFPLVAAIIGFIIMYVAPGNSNRQEFFLEPSITRTIVASATGYFASAFSWLNISFFLFLLILTPFALRITKNMIGFKFYKLIILFLAHFMLVCGMLAGPYHGMGYYGDGRVTNVIYAVFVLTIIVVYGYALGWLQQIKLLEVSFDNAPTYVKKIAVVFCSTVALGGILFFGSDYFDYSTTITAIDEIGRGVHIAYKQEMDHRTAVLNDNNILNPVFDPLEETSAFFGGETLVANKWDWPNGGIAIYYGKESVGLNVEHAGT